MWHMHGHKWGKGSGCNLKSLRCMVLWASVAAAAGLAGRAHVNLWVGHRMVRLARTVLAHVSTLARKVIILVQAGSCSLVIAATGKGRKFGSAAMVQVRKMCDHCEESVHGVR